MYKIILVFFAVITLAACSKKNSSNNGFNDIYPLIAGKWKAIRYEEKTTTGPLGSRRDTLIVNNNINDKGVHFIRYDSVDMIDFISHDTFGVKRTNPYPWYRDAVNNSDGNYYIDWYRNQILWFTGGPFNLTYKIVFNNNIIQIGRDYGSHYYYWTYFERPK